MAIYHCSVKVGSRSSGANAVASDAYREAKKIYDEKLGLTHDYSKKLDVIESITMIPDNAPEEFQNSSNLWNEVERVEKRKDAQVFREVEVALPIELSHEENRKLTIHYVQSQFIDQGMCATVSFHRSKNEENPHAHIMLTTRSVNQDGFGQKNRVWNDRSNINVWREEWAKSVNQGLELNGIEERVDHRSYEEQGIDRLPTVHMGKTATALERQGVHTERGDINREIERENHQSQAVSEEVEQGIDNVEQLLEQFQAQKALEAHQREMQRQREEKIKEKLEEGLRALERKNQRHRGMRM